MILAAHHATYLPNLSFFFKLLSSDIFVLADGLQFTKHSEMNRTRIKTAAGASWLTVPVRTHGRGRQRLCDVEIDTNRNWRHKHWKTVELSYRYAAYFEKFADFFEELYSKPWKSLLRLNEFAIDYLVAQFDVSARVYRLSELKTEAQGAKQILELLSTLGCDVYLADAFWRDYLDSKQFTSQGCELKFFAAPCKPYYQLFGEFIPNLSIIDLLFNEAESAEGILMGMCQ